MAKNNQATFAYLLKAKRGEVLEVFVNPETVYDSVIRSFGPRIFAAYQDGTMLECTPEHRDKLVQDLSSGLWCGELWVFTNKAVETHGIEPVQAHGYRRIEKKAISHL